MHMKYVFHSKFRMIIFHDQKTFSLKFKSSCSQMFSKIGVLKNFAIFTGKYLWWIYSKENQTQVFSCEYCKIFKNTYFEEHLRTAASVLNVTYNHKLTYLLHGLTCVVPRVRGLHCTIVTSTPTLEVDCPTP